MVNSRRFEAVNDGMDIVSDGRLLQTRGGGGAVSDCASRVLGATRVAGEKVDISRCRC